MHPVDLLGQIVGHRRAIGLVVGRDLVAEGRTCQIEGCGEIRRLVVGDELAQHRDEDVDRVRGLSFLVRQAATAKRVIRAVHLRAAIDQEERRASPSAHDIIALDACAVRARPGRGGVRAGRIGVRSARTEVPVRRGDLSPAGWFRDRQRQRISGVARGTARRRSAGGSEGAPRSRTCAGAVPGAGRARASSHVVEA